MVEKSSSINLDVAVSSKSHSLLDSSSFKAYPSYIKFKYFMDCFDFEENYAKH